MDKGKELGFPTSVSILYIYTNETISLFSILAAFLGIGSPFVLFTFFSAQRT
jgi:thiol:disulfide interchange protein